MVWDLETISALWLWDSSKALHWGLLKDWDSKQNTVTQIMSFKQKEKETVRECVDRLRQYIVCCLDSKTPSQEHLISRFLWGIEKHTALKKKTSTTWVSSSTLLMFLYKKSPCVTQIKITLTSKWYRRQPIFSTPHPRTCTVYTGGDCLENTYGYGKR